MLCSLVGRCKSKLDSPVLYGLLGGAAALRNVMSGDMQAQRALRILDSSVLYGLLGGAAALALLASTALAWQLLRRRSRSRSRSQPAETGLVATTGLDRRRRSSETRPESPLQAKTALATQRFEDGTVSIASDAPPSQQQCTTAPLHQQCTTAPLQQQCTTAPLQQQCTTAVSGGAERADAQADDSAFAPAAARKVDGGG